ncbi:MAG: hypothetical protein AseanaTS_05740 [Candidatus Pelagadaptatus aseana]
MNRSRQLLQNQCFYLLLVFCFSAIHADSSHAAQSMKVSTTRYSDDHHQQFSFTVYREGDKSVTLISSESSRKLPDRSQLISFNAGEDLFFFYGDNTRCEQFKGDSFSRAAGTTMMNLIDHFDVSISSPKVEKLDEFKNQTILGYPVRESHWRLSFSITYQLLFKQLNWHVTRDYTLWQTDHQKLPLDPLVVQPTFPKTGFELIDALVEQALENSPGFALKSEFTQTIDASVGKPPKLRVVQQVEAIRDDDTFPDIKGPHEHDCRVLSDKEYKTEGQDILWMLYGKPIQ